MTTPNPKRIILLDSSGVLHRCFHGYRNPRLGEIDGKSMDVAAVYGYLEYTRKLTQELDYDVLVHILDPDGGSAYRFGLYPDYKGQRDSTHPVLSGQKNLLRPVLDAFGHITVRMNGVESDDIIAALAKKYVAQGHEVLVVTSDKDLMQLVKDGEVALARYVENEPGRSKTHEFYEEADVVSKFGVRPDQVADWLALVGDTSDNIPGVHKVGDKTATKWLQEYGTLSAIMTHAADIKGSLGDRLREALPVLPLFRQLTTVLDNIPIDPIYAYEPNEKTKPASWAKAIVNAPSFWPDDLNSDLRDGVQPDPASAPSAPKMR